MNGIGHDGNRMGDLASDDLNCNENRSDDDHQYQSSIIT